MLKREFLILRLSRPNFEFANKTYPEPTPITTHPIDTTARTFSCLLLRIDTDEAIEELLAYLYIMALDIFWLSIVYFLASDGAEGRALAY